MIIGALAGAVIGFLANKTAGNEKNFDSTERFYIVSMAITGAVFAPFFVWFLSHDPFFVR